MKAKPFRLWVLAAVVAVAALAGGLFTGLREHESHSADNAAVQQLMATQLPDLNGQPQRLSQWRGRTLVVNFWAPWCPPCVHEMPALASLSREFEANHVQFVGIGIDSAQNMQAFEQKVKVGYPLLVAGYAGTDLARALGNNAGALPFTVVIDAHGKVRFQKLGELAPDELRSVLQSL